MKKIDYSNPAACPACPLRSRCTTNLRRVSRLENESVRKIDGANKRVYVLTAKIFDGAGEQSVARGEITAKTGVAGVMGVAGGPLRVLSH